MPRPDITEWAGALFRRQLNAVLDYLDGLAVIDGDKGDVTVSGSTWTIDNNAVKTALNASGSAPIYACRAWVNFDGTGTVAIRAGGNVTSITDNGTADYTINFAAAMPDADYAIVGTTSTISGSLGIVSSVTNATDFNKSTTAVRISTYSSGASPVEFPSVNVVIFR